MPPENKSNPTEEINLNTIFYKLGVIEGSVEAMQGDIQEIKDQLPHVCVSESKINNIGEVTRANKVEIDALKTKDEVSSGLRRIISTSFSVLQKAVTVAILAVGVVISCNIKTEGTQIIIGGGDDEVVKESTNVGND